MAVFLRAAQVSDQGRIGWRRWRQYQAVRQHSTHPPRPAGVPLDEAALNAHAAVGAISELLMESLCASSLTVARGHGLKIHPSPGGFQRRRDQTRARPASRSADGSLCYCCRDFLLEVAE